MNALTIKLKQHRLALGLFVLYVLAWLASAFRPISLAGNNPDACARGMGMLYPALAMLAGTFIYSFTLLLFAVFAASSRKFFFGLLLLAIAVPVLLFVAR